MAVLLLSILASAPAAASTTPPDFLAEAASLHDWLVGVRRHLHQIPEILYDLPKTSGAVQDYLTELGIPFKYVCAGLCGGHEWVMSGLTFLGRHARVELRL